jgi:hypothetical protein
LPKAWATPLASLLTQLKVQEWKEMPTFSTLFKTLDTFQPKDLEFKKSKHVFASPSIMMSLYFSTLTSLRVHRIALASACTGSHNWWSFAQAFRISTMLSQATTTKFV